MTCFSPIEIDRKTKSGQIIGRQKVPCGRCNGCRISKSKEWAIRCVHEAKTHTHNEFITLTYNDANLPPDHGLDHLHFQKFIRSLRKKTKQKIRYYMCGEYGKATEKNNFIARPHFHAILFGYQFPDKQTHANRRGHITYTSEYLSETWTKGFHEIGSVTFESAAYVARYIIKKQKTDSASLAIFDQDTGEITGYRKNEYTHMSLKPGIGAKYYEANIMDIFPNDFVMIKPGQKMEVPKYYKESLKREHPELAEILRKHRVQKSKASPDNTPSRLATREYIQGRRIDQLKREIE